VVSFGPPFATTTLPTATEDELGTDKWTLGPGFQLGQVSKQSVIGGFINHQWDAGGSGDTDIDLTTVQFLGIYPVADGTSAVRLLLAMTTKARSGLSP